MVNKRVLLLFGGLMVLLLIGVTQAGLLDIIFGDDKPKPTNDFTIAPIPNGWKVIQHTGDEEVLFNIKITQDRACLIPRFVGTKTFFYNYTTIVKTDSELGLDKEVIIFYNKTYTQPTTLAVKTLDTSTLSTSLDKEISLEEVGYFCYDLDLSVAKTYKFGNNSGIIIGTTSYNPDYTINITEETGLAHLNMTTSPTYQQFLYYPFDIANGSAAPTTVFDYSSKGYDGTLVGGMSYNETGGFGGSYIFNGVSGKITHGLEVANDEGTICAWHKPLADDRYMVSVYESDCTSASCNGYGAGSTAVIEFNLGTYGDGTWVWGMQDGSNTYIDVRGGTVTTGVWKHICATWEEKENLMILYENGAEVASNDGFSAEGFAGRVPNVIQIGSVGNGQTLRWWYGEIDEVKYFPSALSQTEINETYHYNTLSFARTGHMNFTDVNISSVTETVNRVNVSFESYEALRGTNVSVSVNGGAWSNFSADGIVTDLEVASNPDNVNFSFMLISNTNLSYTPNVIGNITLTSWYDDGGAGDLINCGTPPEDIEGNWLINESCIINSSILIYNNVTQTTNSFVIIAADITWDKPCSNNWHVVASDGSVTHIEKGYQWIRG